MNKLDKYQLQAVKSLENTLLIAAAGSGKTFTIIKKIEYLINNLKYKSNEILIISFTNKSVDDLKAKINFNTNIYTFHKLAIDILNYNKIQYKISSENQLNYIIDEYFYLCNETTKKSLMKYFDYYNYQLFLDSNALIKFKEIIYTFISLYKANNITYKKLNEIYLKNNLFMKIILQILYIYNQELKSKNEYDFDMLLTTATNYVTNYKKIKYIIIDEFQDTSIIRWNLINKLRIVNNAKIFVVGDDYQSIYRFSGCDLDLFVNFKKYVPDSKILKLKYTYRNSQELIDICAKFITKNKYQITKDLISHKHLNNPVKIIYYYNKKNALSFILDRLITNKLNILVLGRNNFDIYSYLSSNMHYENNIITYKNSQIKYMSVHSSKGLESDIVIIINLINDLYGFPNKILNHRIIKDILPIDKYLYEEERRLFYVALTRTKNEVYLLTPYFHKSIFIKEIKKIVK